MFRDISIFIVAVSIIMPLIAMAGLVPCNPTYDPVAMQIVNKCGLCQLFKLIDNIFDYVAMTLTPVVSVVALILGAIFMMAGGANESLKQRGKQVLWGTFIGVVIVLLSWVLIDTVINIVADQAGKGGLAPWNSIQCS